MAELKVVEQKRPPVEQYEDQYYKLPSEKWLCGNCGRVGRSPWHSCRDVTDRKWMYLR